MKIAILTWLLEASVCLTLFWGFYHFVLRNRTHFGWNRAYLLLMVVLSLGIPLLDIPVNFHTHDTIAPVIEATQSWDNMITQLAPDEDGASVGVTIQGNAVEFVRKPSVIPQLFWVYLGGILWASIRLFRSIRDILRKIRLSSGQKHPGYYVLDSEENEVAFSFLNYVFTGNKFRDLPKESQDYVLAHEYVHLSHRHSLDILIFELLSVFFWFHPLMRFIKADVREIHEFIADDKVAVEMGKHDYSRLIVSLAGNTGAIPLTNQFAFMPVKRRVQMLLNRSRSGKAIFLSVAPLLMFSTAIFSTSVHEILPEPVRIKSVVSIKIIPEKPAKTDIPSIRPLDNHVISGFGMRVHPILKTRKMHVGVDFFADLGTPVVATADGTVTFAGRKSKGGYGILIDLKHGTTGYETRYSHLSDVAIEEGEKVRQGQVIGYSGNSGLSKGPHLHYEVKKDEKYVNPADYFPKYEGEKGKEESMTYD